MNNTTNKSLKKHFGLGLIACSLLGVKAQSTSNEMERSPKTISVKLKRKDITKNTFGKGITIQAADSSFSMKFSTRIQNRVDGTITDGGNPSYQGKAYLRRARLKFDGFAYSPKLKYKMEFDVVNGFVLDAVLKWNFYKNVQLWYGQTKLPGNRERIISSQKLQFVDRSLLNSKFNIDRDHGFQLRNHHKLGNMIIREMLSISQGEGLNDKRNSEGQGYTARLEILPFGKFAGKGDYFSSDLKREPKPKLALGVTYDFNDKAVKSGGQLGDDLTEARNLSTIFADMMFKYRGLSWMTEYTNKTIADGSTPYITADSKSFYTGSAINTQLGYLFKSNWEIAGRYTMVDPETETQNNDITEYTLGISKYIVGHSLKVQGDVSLREEDTQKDEIIFRLQAELSF